VKAIEKERKAFLLRTLAALAILALCLGPALTSLPAHADDGGAAAAVAVPAVEAAPAAGAATTAEAAPVVEATSAEAAPAVEATSAEATTSEAAATAVEATSAEATTSEAAATAVEATSAEATATEAATAVEATSAAEAAIAEAAPAVEATSAEAIIAEAMTKVAKAAVTTTEASVITDKADYGPNELATFKGGGFTPNSEVTLTLTEPSGIETVWTATTDETGSFTTTYQLVAGMQDTYTITATDGTSSTQTSFTDAWTYYGVLGQKIWTVDDASATIYWISNQPGANNTTLLQQDVTNERAALKGRVQPVLVLLHDGSNNLTSQFTVNKVSPSGTWLNINAGNTGTIAGTVTAGAGTTYEGLVYVTTGIYGENRLPFVGWLPTLAHVGTTANVFGVDSTSPTVTGTLPEAGRYWYKNDVVINWLAQDQTGLSGICQVGGDPTWNSFTQGDTSVSGSSTSTSEGIYTLTGTATDCAANPGSGTVAFGIDLTDPSLSGTAQGDQRKGWFNNPANAQVQWTAQDLLSGLPDGSGGWTTNQLIWFVSIPEGKNQSFTETVTDQAGNSTSETVSGVNADYTAPTVTRVASAPTGDNGWYVVPVDITLNAEDATSGLQWLRYWIDGNRTQLNGKGANTLNTNFQINQEGEAVKFEYRAMDIAGNKSPRPKEYYKIDLTDPTLTKTLLLATPDGNNGWYVTPVEVTLTATDDTSGVHDIQYSINGAAAMVLSGAEDTKQLVEQFNLTADGIYDLTHQTSDYAGRTTVVAPQTIKIDQTDPNLTKDAVRTGTSEITVTLTGTDATSGVDFIRYSTDGGTSWTTVQSDTTTFTLTGIGNHNLGHLVLDIAGNDYVLPDQVLTVEGPAVGGTAPGSIQVNMMGTVASYLRTADGVLLEDIEITSPDGLLTLRIPAGTSILGAGGSAADNIQILPSGGFTPPEGYQMVAAYQFTPSDITFTPNATLIANYDPAAVPDGMTPVISYFDETAGAWVEVETAGFVAGGIAIPNAVIGQVGGAHTFAILAK
jgi:hypothetical protein